MISVEEMKRLEDSCGIPKITLMQSAGRGIYEQLKKIYDLKGKQILVVCHHGNNGGDGFVAAEYLSKECEVDIYFIGDEEKLKEEAKANYDIVLKNPKIQFFDISYYELDLIDFNSYDIIIDALLGTGTKGDIKDTMAAVIDKINESKAFKLSIDVPTGIDPNTGKKANKYVEADLTVTFHDIKPGLDPEKTVIVDIGIKQL
ncbi:MAG: NAD(P)H-hydrate epimerase [Nanoarchaeota archaeon]|nr:NAD(P)H-hydrate epimerase [Nanoarchaeota archaeon]MBU1703764.1 NAD(P)H-hydrate epimerase [Nanoarchaeota archaeon]